jgi:hypothetical protein
MTSHSESSPSAQTSPQTPPETPPATSQTPDAPQVVAVNYEYSFTLPQVLEQLDVSVLFSTYQAGRVASIGVHQGEMRVGFAYFDGIRGLAPGEA